MTFNDLSKKQADNVHAESKKQAEELDKNMGVHA